LPDTYFKENKSWRSFSAENDVKTIEYQIFLREKKKIALYLFISKPLFNSAVDKATVYSQLSFNMFTLLKKNWLGRWNLSRKK
jgi:hypothetical protein